MNTSQELIDAFVGKNKAKKFPYKKGYYTTISKKQGDWLISILSKEHSKRNNWDGASDLCLTSSSIPCKLNGINMHLGVYQKYNTTYQLEFYTYDRDNPE